jgi:hypothetical protein
VNHLFNVLSDKNNNFTFFSSPPGWGVGSGGVCKNQELAYIQVVVYSSQFGNFEFLMHTVIMILGTLEVKKLVTCTLYITH